MNLAGVDAATETAIMSVLKGLQEDGKTIISVHHDLSTVSTILIICFCSAEGSGLRSSGGGVYERKYFHCLWWQTCCSAVGYDWTLMLWAALSLSLGYNATLVTLGASLLGAAGMAGTFLYLRKNALISDAISHATLPGLGFAFLVAFGFGIDGRQLPILLSGSALSAALGVYVVNWLTRETRLTQDTAIGCVLSVFFAFGVVLLTIIQVIPAGRKAGLESFLLGSTAGMLYSDALLILVLSIITALVLFVFLRPIKLVVFDQGYSETLGISVRRVDFIILAVTLAVTVLGMKIVGLILIVALLIIPAVSARFWSERTNIILVTATLFGALSGYIGSAISAVSPGLPTGPIIVLCCFGFFLFSFLFAPKRGVLAVTLDHYRFQSWHLTQGFCRWLRRSRL